MYVPCGDVVETTEAPRQKAHAPRAVVVEPAQLSVHGFGEVPGFGSVDEDRKDDSHVSGPFGARFDFAGEEDGCQFAESSRGGGDARFDVGQVVDRRG